MFEMLFGMPSPHNSWVTALHAVGCAAIVLTVFSLILLVGKI
jgi:hypothetical protein